MIRTVFAVATTAAIALGVCAAAVAQEDPIKARKALMKANGDQAKILSDMSKGDKPYDQAAVTKALAQFQDAAAK
nr:cytochrome c [Bradyrhizobium sp.]